MAFAPVYPHDPIEEIAEDVFMARGSIRMNALMTITRNMAVVRNDGELSLVDPLRLNEAGEKQIEALGQVKHILRLGCFHGLDDPYYVERFKPEHWCQPGGTTYTEPAIDHELTAGGELPFPDAELFCFEQTKQPESVLLLRRGDGLLLTCDAIQNYGDYRHNNLPARLLMPFIGFPKTTLIGPLWLKGVTRDGGSLKSEFERLLDLPFDSLLSAHGSFLPSGAHAAVTAALNRAFPD